MTWWDERLRPRLVLAGERWAKRSTDYLRQRFDIPRRS